MILFRVSALAATLMLHLQWVFAPIQKVSVAANADTLCERTLSSDLASLKVSKLTIRDFRCNFTYIVVKQ